MDEWGGIHKYICKDKSVIDYFLYTPPFFKSMYDFDVLEFTSLYSDVHSPISFALRTHRFNLNEVRDGSNSDKTTIRLWNPEKSNCFNDNFSITEISNIDSKLSSMKNKTCLQQSEMGDIVMRINQVFENCAEELFGHFKQGRKTQDKDITKSRGLRITVTEREISITTRGADTILITLNMTNKF